jgi:hypothetical protein
MQKLRPKTNLDEVKLPWEKRFVDPFIRMVWNARIEIEPAHVQKGRHIGFRNYPDGTRELFEVSPI